LRSLNRQSGSGYFFIAAKKAADLKNSGRKKGIFTIMANTL